jgi:hypothetical protein
MAAADFGTVEHPGSPLSLTLSTPILTVFRVRRLNPGGQLRAERTIWLAFWARKAPMNSFGGTAEILLA